MADVHKGQKAKLHTRRLCAFFRTRVRKKGATRQGAETPPSLSLPMCLRRSLAVSQLMTIISAQQLLCYSHWPLRCTFFVRCKTTTSRTASAEFYICQKNKHCKTHCHDEGTCQIIVIVPLVSANSLLVLLWQKVHAKVMETQLEKIGEPWNHLIFGFSRQFDYNIAWKYENKNIYYSTKLINKSILFKN